MLHSSGPNWYRKPDFAAPNCPVRGLRYYHRYMTKHPELRKGRCRLFIPYEDNNVGKELSAASISGWICILMLWILMLPFRTARVSKERSKLMRSVLWLLITIFNKVDLQAVMKAGRRSGGGTFMSFYLRDLCPQADSIRKTGTNVTTEEIIKIYS